MAFTRDKERLQIRASKDVAKKIRLEPKLANDMRRMFKSMVKDFRRTYPKSQTTIMPQHYLTDTIGILRTHYRKVSKAFASSNRDELEKGLEGKAKKLGANITDKVNAKMGEYIIQHSSTQAHLIMKTTQDQLQKAIVKAVTDSANTGVPIDSTQIAKVVSDDYLAKINGRVKTISMTEVQSISEKTKDVELEAMDGDEDYAAKQLTRVWVAILDDRTRDWHAEADGQEVGIDEPFIVDGEELDYPGDPNGSDDNIINCRCVALPVED